MRAIDTNVLVRLVTRDDEAQAAAAETFVRGGAWVSLIVLVETVWVLDAVYERTPLQLAAGIELLLDHRDLVIQDADTVRLALEEFKRRPSAGFSDCLILEQARKAGHLPLATFDKSFAKLDDVQRI